MMSEFNCRFPEIVRLLSGLLLGLVGVFVWRQVLPDDETQGGIRMFLAMASACAGVMLSSWALP